MRRDQAGMDREIQWSKGRPEEAEFTSLLGATALSSGKVKQAEELQKRALEMFKRQDRQENAAGGFIALAGDMMVVGKCGQAKDYAKTALSLSRGEKSRGNAAMLYAACDDQSQALSLLEEARAAYPKNTVVASIITPIVKAGIEKSRGNYAQAVQLLEPLRSYEGGVIVGVGVNYARGNLYLESAWGTKPPQSSKRSSTTRESTFFHRHMHSHTLGSHVRRCSTATRPARGRRTRISLRSGRRGSGSAGDGPGAEGIRTTESREIVLSRKAAKEAKEERSKGNFAFLAPLREISLSCGILPCPDNPQSRRI